MRPRVAYGDVRILSDWSLLRFAGGGSRRFRPPTSMTAPVHGIRRWRALAASVVALTVMVLSGCQLDVRVDTVVAEDGSGTVTVAVGLDDDALSRVGDPATMLRVDDLKAAGWTVAFAERDAATGMTVITASKPFADPEQAAFVLGEVSGADGPLREVRLTREASVARNAWTFSGTIDLSEGFAAFSDPDVAAALGGDPLGGNVAAIEAEEGAPAADMVDVTFTVDLPHAEPQSWTPGFADATPTVMTAESSQLLPVPFFGGEGGPSVMGLAAVGGVVALGVLGLVALRRRFAARR